MKYMATINGKRYEVEVERVETYKSLDRGVAAAAAPPALGQSKAAPVQRAAAPAAPVQRAAAPAPAPAAPAPAAAVPAGATTIEAPMPGKILGVKGTVGQAVKYGQAVIIMEAMKMETEIVAPADGTISQILVKTGDTVETGSAMVVLN